MQYWYLNSLGNPVGGPLVSSETSFGSRIRSALSRWFGVSEAVAEGEPRLIQGRETTFKVSATLPKAPRGVGPLVLASGRGRPEEIARGLMGGRFERSVDPTAGVETFAGTGRTLITFGGDGFLLEEPDEYGDEPVGMKQAEAVELAAAYLAENGMMPDDALLSDVTGVMAASLDPLTGELAGETTSAYIVEYRHEFDGIPIAGVEGDVISVVVASGGRVCQARNTWRQPSHAGRAVKLIDAEEALAEVVRDGERVEGLPAVADVSGVRLVYYANRGNSRQNVMWPAWEFTLAGEGDEDGAAPARVFVDARTGRVVTD
jgi:hypothetical protein